MSRKYAVVDLETTGGIPNRDKITEVAVIIFDGEKIIGDYKSLINPERLIPPNITRITGITNAMVETAPKFYEVAKDLIEIMEGTIFVAHNVRFDYQFLREEFKSLGFTFTKRHLCTVKLARKAFPKLKSYSLGNLIRYFKIEVENRHRAYDDAWATTILLEKIFAQQDGEEGIKELINSTLKLTRLPKGITEDQVEDLPEECGVYYMSDSADQILYIGKSINIKKRIKQHFSKQTKKTDKLYQQVTQISYEITGSELASLLKESKEIKEVLPPINKIQKTKDYDYVIERRVDKSGYFYYEVLKATKAKDPLSYYSNRKTALHHIENIGEAFQLCHKINKIDKGNISCFNYGVQKCLGGCIGEEPPFMYNERFIESLAIVNKLFEDNFVLLEDGRTPGEKAVFLVEGGHYQGYGYVDGADVGYGIEELKEAIKYEKLNPEADMLLRNYMWSHEKVEVLHF